jgi:hypothetical protein
MCVMGRVTFSEPEPTGPVCAKNDPPDCFSSLPPSYAMYFTHGKCDVVLPPADMGV